MIAIGLVLYKCVAIGNTCLYPPPNWPPFRVQFNVDLNLVIPCKLMIMFHLNLV